MLGTSVLVLPTRIPVVLAKEIATLQHLSDGRFIYGVGTGWYPPEFEAVGRTRQQRGARTDEVLEASMQLLKGAARHLRGPALPPPRRHRRAAEPRPAGVGGGRPAAGARGLARPAAHGARRCSTASAAGTAGSPARQPSHGQIVEDLPSIDAELIRRGRGRAQHGLHHRARELLLAHREHRPRRRVIERAEALPARRRLRRAAVGLHRDRLPDRDDRRDPAANPGAHRRRASSTSSCTP